MPMNWQTLLNKEGIKIGMIHGGLTPRERKQQMKRIRNLD